MFVGKFCLAQTDGTFLREENLKRISRGKTKSFKWFKDLIGSGVREVAVVYYIVVTTTTRLKVFLNRIFIVKSSDNREKFFLEQFIVWQSKQGCSSLRKILQGLIGSMGAIVSSTNTQIEYALQEKGIENI